MTSASAALDSGFASPPLGRHEFGGLTFTEFCSEGGRRIASTCRDAASFRLLLGGSCIERRGARVTVQHPFTVFFHPPGCEFEADAGASGAHVFLVELSAAWMDRMQNRGDWDIFFAELHGGDLLWQALQLYGEYARQPNRFFETAVEGIAMGMLASAMRGAAIQARPAPAWLDRAAAMLQSGAATDPGLPALAAAAGVHPVHLSRVFRRHFQCTLSEYGQKKRLQMACRQMTAEPDATWADIAFRCGFADQSHLTHVFRNVAGITPGGFRASLPIRRRMAQAGSQSGAVDGVSTITSMWP